MLHLIRLEAGHQLSEKQLLRPWIKRVKRSFSYTLDIIRLFSATRGVSPCFPLGNFFFHFSNPEPVSVFCLLLTSILPIKLLPANLKLSAKLVWLLVSSHPSQVFMSFWLQGAVTHELYRNSVHMCCLTLWSPNLKILKVLMTPKERNTVCIYITFATVHPAFYAIYILTMCWAIHLSFFDCLKLWNRENI